MTRVVDHAARKEAVAEAVWKVVARRGVQALSVRAVASEMQASTAAVTHYFPSREQLLLRAFELVAERAGQRMRRHVRDDIRGEHLVILGRVLGEAVPLDDERRTEAAIWYAFIGLAAGSPPLREAARDRYRCWHRFVAELLQAAHDAGTAPIDDIDRVTAEAIAVAEGVALRAHLDPEHLPPRAQQALLQAWIDRLAAKSGPGTR